MPTPSQPTTPLGTPAPTGAQIQTPSVRRPPPANVPPGFRPISSRTAALTFAPVTANSAQAPTSADKLLAAVKRHNAMARNSEQMFAVVKRFKDLCNTGVIVSKTTQAECDRIIAAIEGGAA
jgi:hypothetical protein